MDIKVLGPGCTESQKTKQILEDAVKEADIDANIEKITDVMEIASYGIFGTPAVVVNGDVKCVGKIPVKEEVVKWLKE